MIRVLRETHGCPAEIQERLTSAGGRNRFGEPNFRIVWGWSRLQWIGGWWMDRDTEGNVTREVFEMRQEPAYLPPWDRWVLEAWRPPEWYGSPWFWDLATTLFSGDEASRMLPGCGPYPSRGDYFYVTTIDYVCGACKAKADAAKSMDEKRVAYRDCMEREFLQVTPRVAETLARMVIRGREADRAETRQQIYAQMAAEDRLIEQMNEDTIQEAMDAELPKERMEYIERVSGPAMNAHLKELQKRMEQVPLEARSAAFRRRGFQISPRDFARIAN